MPKTWTPIHGGTVNQVWTDGKVIRRRSSPASQAVSLLWAYLNDRGLGLVPQSLRYNSRYEYQSRLPGKALMRPWPPEALSSTWLAMLGSWMREFHMASRAFTLPKGVSFQWGPKRPFPGSVVCHGDLGPWNCLLSGKRLTGIVDWELAHYGRAIDDLCSAAYTCVPLRQRADQEFPPAVISRRLDALLKGYGRFSRATLYREFPRYLLRNAGMIERRAREGAEPFVSFVKRGLNEELRSESARFRARMPSDGS
jgi:hypothetical protein